VDDARIRIGADEEALHAHRWNNQEFHRLHDAAVVVASLGVMGNGFVPMWGLSQDEPVDRRVGRIQNTHS
jgi:hypothetical protein